MILSILNIEIFVAIVVCFFTLYGVFLEKIVGSKRNDVFHNIKGLVSYTFVCLVYLWFEKLNGTILIWNNQIISDKLYHFFAFIIILFSLVLVLLPTEIKYSYEYFILIFTYLLGCFFILNAYDFTIFYLAVELQAFSVYILIALNTKSTISIESAYKYFIMGALGSFCLLLGGVCFYGLTGSLNYFDWYLLFFNIESQNGLEIASLASFLFIAGFLLKLGLAPLHFWIADVYEGCSWNVLVLVALINKITLVVTFLRLYEVFYQFAFVSQLLLLFAMCSLIFGLMGALQQTNLKRFFAYTGVVNLGYIIGSLSLFTFGGIYGSLFYFVIYLVNFAAFIFLLVMLRDINRGRSLNDINEIGFLVKSIPLLVFFLSLLLFSFGGVPPLGGFFGKFLLLYAILEEQAYILLTLVVIASVVSVFYYIRVIKKLYFMPQKEFILFNYPFKGYGIFYSVLPFVFFNFIFFIKPYFYFLLIDELVISLWLGV